MSANSDKVKKWRQRLKSRIIEAMGGCCVICSYNKCPASLSLHHIDPSQKDFNFALMRANPKSWDSIISELRKCALVCHNCHHEIHAGFVNLPETFSRFNENFVSYKEVKEIKTIKKRGKVDWESIDIINELKTKNFSSLGRELNCSANAVKKRYLRISNSVEE